MRIYINMHYLLINKVVDLYITLEYIPSPISINIYSSIMKKKQQAQGYITSQTTNGVALKGFDNHQTQLFAYIQKSIKTRWYQNYVHSDTFVLKLFHLRYKIDNRNYTMMETLKWLLYIDTTAVTIMFRFTIYGFWRFVFVKFVLVCLYVFKAALKIERKRV